MNDLFKAAQQIQGSFHGLRAAAWLVWKFKRSLHATGAFRVVVPYAAAMPAWFLRAVTVMRKRDTWRVRASTSPDGNVYEFRWLAGQHYKAPRADYN